MKNLIALLLALAIILSLAAVSVLAIDSEDYENQDVFDIKEPSGVLSPGVDYYFDCTWQGGDITDDFFEFYKTGVSIGSVDSREEQRESGYNGTKASTAKKIVEVAEFVKLDNSDKYYFHFRAKGSYRYDNDDDAEIRITVTAYDKSRDKKRVDYKSWVEVDVDVGYPNKNVVKQVTATKYEVDNDYPMVEFDDDLDYCQLIFEDGSYYNIELEKVREFNLGQTTDMNGRAAAAYPNANLKCVSFYAHPSFAHDSVLRVKAPGCEYLYEIENDNKLVLVAQGNNGGYLGYTTSRLGSYVASDVALDTSLFAASTGNYVNYAVTASQVNTTAGSTASTTIAQGSGSQSFDSTSGGVITNPNTGAAA